jgi:hypothetical protein
MRAVPSTTTVTTAGTRVQLSTALDKVVALLVKARQANTGLIYFGISNVASTVAYTLSPGEVLPVPFPQDVEVPIADFWIDSSVNGEKMDWVAYYQP